MAGGDKKKNRTQGVVAYMHNCKTRRSLHAQLQNLKPCSRRVRETGRRLRRLQLEKMQSFTYAGAPGFPHLARREVRETGSAAPKGKKDVCR